MSLCDLSLETKGMWEEGSFSNNKGEIGADRYTITGHLQAGMFVYLKTDKVFQHPFYSLLPYTLGSQFDDWQLFLSCCLHRCVRAFQNNKFFWEVDGWGEKGLNKCICSGICPITRRKCSRCNWMRIYMEVNSTANSGTLFHTVLSLWGILWHKLYLNK